jgi:7,8-dihydropterin-6-yl-methyl-4-(beta-D-ribofuranosyl)aminobenzene 5'-phosphate synthase
VIKKLSIPFLIIFTTSWSGHAKQNFDNNTIINLYDAFGKEIEGLEKDFGFSAIIRYKGKTILFDTGTNADKFKKNTEVLGIDLKEVDFAIASHAHFDHINGFDYLLEVNPDIIIYFPYDVFYGAPLPFDLSGTEPEIRNSLPPEMRYFDGDKTKITLNQSGRFWKANIEYVRENKEIMPGISLIATQSPYMGYFSKYPNLNIAGEKSKGEEQAKFLGLPELSLSLKTSKGEVLIVGCSHSTVDAIITETKMFTEHNIDLVYGGYHLLPYKSGELSALADKLKNELGVNRVAPTHCTGHLAFKIFKDYFGKNYLFAGLGEKIGFED